jgi:signal transduction histidine kinase
MNTVNQSAHTLLEIVNDILDFSNWSRKIRPLHWKHHVRELLKEITDLILYEAKSKNLDLELNVQSDIPVLFFGLRWGLKQILINLLANELNLRRRCYQVKCNPDKQVSSNKARIRFAVIDSGIGIQEKQK